VKAVVIRGACDAVARRARRAGARCSGVGVVRVSPFRRMRVPWTCNCV